MRQPAETAQVVPPTPEADVRSRGLKLDMTSFLSKPLRLFGVGLATTGALAPEVALADAGTPAAHIARHVVRKSTLPPEPNGKETVKVAKAELLQAHFKVGGEVGPGQDRDVAIKWLKRVAHHHKYKSHGHTTTKTSYTYTPYQPKSKLEQGTKVWIATKKPTTTQNQPPTKPKTPPVNPQPPTNPKPPPTPQPPNTPPTPIDVKAAVEADLSKHTDYLPFWGGGCTGLEVDNASNQPIGEKTNGHCDRDQQSVTVNGQNYLNVGMSPDVMHGDSVDNLTKVGTVSEIARPSQASKYKWDYTVMAFQGHNIQEVIQAVQQRTATASQIAYIIANKVPVALEGFPLAQPGNTGPTKMALQWLTLLGNGAIFASNGDYTPALVAAGTAGPTDIIGSYGESGGDAEAPIVSTDPATGTQTVNNVWLGGEGGFDDFRTQGNTVTPISPSYNGPAVRTERQNEFNSMFGENLNLMPYDWIADLTSEDPTVAGADPEYDILVSSQSQIPSASQKK